MFIKFKKISYKNLLSVGNNPVEINLDSSPTTLLFGKNGNGKCLFPTTKINISINNNEIEELFKEFIDEKKGNDRRKD